MYARISNRVAPDRPPRAAGRPKGFAFFAVSTLGAGALVAGLGGPGCSSDSESNQSAAPIADASTDQKPTNQMDGSSRSHPDAALAPEAAPLDAGDGSTSDSGAAADLPAELIAFCQRYAGTLCDSQIACAFSDLPPRDQCVAGANAQCLRVARLLLPSIRAGRVVYDGTKVDACFQDAKAPFCSTSNFGSDIPSCQMVFRGTVQAGGVCYAPYVPMLVNGFRLDECAPGAYCTSGTSVCPGTCAAYAKAGDPCTELDGHCGPGNYCTGTKCAPLLGLGESCAAAGAQCGSALRCGATDAPDGGLVCEAPRTEGQSCKADAECDRFYCLTGTCRPGHEGEECLAFGKCDVGLKCGIAGCQKPIAAGGACSSPDACADGLVCQVEGRNDAGDPVGHCHVPETPAAGQPCFNGKCAAGAWCDTSGSGTATCRTSGSVGDPCSILDDSCASGLACNGVTGKCQTPSGAGGACDPDSASTCKPGFACSPGHVCAAKVGAGAACSFRAECPENYDCVGGTCRFGKLPGQTCVASDLCIGGVCVDARGTCNGDCVDPGN